MGWPNADPEGWDEVERRAVGEWMRKEQLAFTSEWPMREEQRTMLLLWLQAEHGNIFRAMVEALPTSALSDAEADYLERKFSTGEGS